MKASPSAARLLLCAAAALLTVAGAAGADRPDESRLVHGESLVLAGDEPGRLWRGRAERGSVIVRSTYLPGLQGTVIYEEGRDYAVEYDRGEVRRLEGSRIPDYRQNSLYGRKDFNHTQFPGFGNYRDFIFVDYHPREAVRWPVQPRQDSFLRRTRERLRRGEPVTVVAFGDSITAGGDATTPELIYWQRWLTALRA
ncbi:MAG TPA: hypothetical protein VFU47_02005, partial [Armatimonadota bacterium]|nr:hypothetical protein [Armatimonadota bacterium]